MIIKCPECGRRFDLQRRPPKMFHCPKCSFTVPFSVLLNEQNGEVQAANTIPGNVNVEAPESNGTRIVDSLHNDDKTRIVDINSNADKTRLVESMQIKKQGEFIVSFEGHNCGVIRLPYGKSFDVGRRSSDSKAQIKLTPDMSMSRIHAGMRTVNIKEHVIYQITSVKASNPVYVNGQPIPPGKAYNLKSGDKVVMGKTSLEFRMV